VTASIVPVTSFRGLLLSRHPPTLHEMLSQLLDLIPKSSIYYDFGTVDLEIETQWRSQGWLVRFSLPFRPISPYSW
jgi:hypothetical protein